MCPLGLKELWSSGPAPDHAAADIVFVFTVSVYGGQARLLHESLHTARLQSWMKTLGSSQRRFIRMRSAALLPATSVIEQERLARRGMDWQGSTLRLGDFQPDSARCVVAVSRASG